MAGASQSVTYNPPTPAVVQSKYAANCNAVNCGLAYTSNVAAGNALVFALGWNGQSPPSTPTDTRGDTFTLGASTSVQSGTSSPSIAQQRYTSNCNAVNCGLAYSSNVAAGNTLVYGLGWYGQGPPSTPTDTRGDTFTLGASTSVQSGSSGTPALDGSATGSFTSAASGTVTLTTSLSNDVIVVMVEDEDVNNAVVRTVSSVTATGLAFAHRSTGSINASPYTETEVWWAAAASALSSKTITVTLSGSIDDASIVAFGVSGANTATPWDANGALPATATGASSANPTVNGVSTSNANDMLLGFTGLSLPGSGTPATETAGAGYTLIQTQVNGGATGASEAAAEYKVVAATQSSVSVAFATANTNWIMTGDAIQASGLTYYSYVWYATAASSGADTITAAFGSTVAGTVSIYEVSGATTAGALSSTGSSAPGSTSASVSSFTPSSNSFVVGNVETGSGTSKYTVGAGYATVAAGASGCDANNAAQGCDENKVGGGSATTVPFTLSASTGWVEAAMSFGPAPIIYYSYIWYATAASSGADTITAAFGSTVAGTISIYEIIGYSTSGTLSSTGSNSGSTAASVSSFTPGSNSFVVGNVETAASSTKYTVGAGYTTVASGAGGCDASNAAQGCDEYQTGLGSATTAPFTLSASTAWAEAAMSFAPLSPITYYSYIWYATAASSGADTVTATFAQAVTGSISIYEMSGVTATGLLSSTGSSNTAQAARQ